MGLLYFKGTEKYGYPFSWKGELDVLDRKNSLFFSPPFGSRWEDGPEPEKAGG